MNVASRADWREQRVITEPLVEAWSQKENLGVSSAESKHLRSSLTVKPLKKTDRRTAIAIHNSESSGLAFFVEDLEEVAANGYAINQVQHILIELT
jgi:hypothetical protein